MGELGWSILNGSVKGDEEGGEWTYTGEKGGTVIKYMMGNEETRERVVGMKVEEWVDLDHQPITVWLEEGGRKERKRKQNNKGRKGIWTEEGKKKFEEYFVERKEEG